MTTQTRRTFLKNSAAIAVSGTLTANALPGLAFGTKARKFTLQLDTGSIGIQASQHELLNLAHQYGFESISAYPQSLGEMSSGELNNFLAEMKEKGIVWGTSGLPFDFRKDETTFREGVAQLPKHAQALQKAGVTRMGTWILPSHNELTYLENFKQHATRLREITKIVGDHGIRFGLEYVGPKTSRISKKYAFIYSMKETKELIAEIGNDNVGFILDTYHWYNAGETKADILTLTKDDVVSGDLNDAQAGIPRDELMDLARMLPVTTGVIDAKGFLEALVEIGFDGPIRAEPFNKTVNNVSQENALRITAETMKKAFTMVE